jgi:hypothetical protein
MLNQFSNSFSVVLALFLLLTTSASAETKGPSRISSKVMDLGKVTPIRMVPGMATIIEVPGPVTGIRLGNPEAVQYFRPERPDNEVTLILQRGGVKPTNLIVRSGKKKFVFDIVPSTRIHQDTVEVVGAYGGPALQDAEIELLDSSDKGGA